MEATRGQKHPSEAKKCMKESIYWKKFLMKVAQQPQKPPYTVQSDLNYNLRVESFDFWGHQGHSCAKHAKHLRTSKAGVPGV